MRVLPLRGFGLKESTQSCAVFRGRILPIGLDRIPAFAQPVEIGITVLRDHGCDPLGMTKREAKADRRAVVEDVDGKAAELEHLGKPLDNVGQVLNVYLK